MQGSGSNRSEKEREALINTRLALQELVLVRPRTECADVPEGTGVRGRARGPRLTDFLGSTTLVLLLPFGSILKEIPEKLWLPSFNFARDGRRFVWRRRLPVHR